MKNFESDYNRWLDGSLNDAERREFEAGLDVETLRAGRDWPGIRDLLKASAREITLPHPDFFNEQVRREIEKESLHTQSPALLPLRRLFWAGVCCVLTAVVLTLCFLPPQNRPGTIVSLAETASPEASASAFQTPGGLGAVIWLEGVRYIPDGESVQ